MMNIQLRISRPEKYPAKQHVQRVAAKLKSSKGLVYLLGQYQFNLEDSDQPKTWRQRRYFYYCSGVDVPNCCLTYDIETDELRLYIPEIHPEQVVWVGRGPTVKEAEDMYDVDTVRLNGSLFDDLKSWQQHNKDATFFILHESHKPDIEFSNDIESKKLQPAIDNCRIIKDTYEIERIRYANDISALAHRTVLQRIEIFSNEAQIQGLFQDVCITRQAKKQAYSIIAGSGENAGVLHYTKNDEPLAGRQLVCLDAGAEWENYAADVTRTFPMSSQWPSEEARAIYELVEEIQDSCIGMLKPGVYMLDLHTHTHRMVIKGLLKLGILEGSPDAIYEAGTSKGFYPHGLGHHLGLDVHDILGVPILKYSTNDCPPVLDLSSAMAPCRPDQPPLEEGMVITIEPGIYFSRYELNRAYLSSPIHSKFINKDVLDRYWAVGGVRIEDNLLITQDGYENLTTAPKGEEALQIIKQGAGGDAWDSR